MYNAAALAKFFVFPCSEQFMKVSWVVIFNRLFEVINQPGECYFSGARFISKVRELTRTSLTIISTSMTETKLGRARAGKVISMTSC